MKKIGFQKGVLGLIVLYGGSFLVASEQKDVKKAAVVKEVVKNQDNAPDFLYGQNLELARKREITKALIAEGQQLLATHSLVDFFNQIVHNPKLVRGEIFLFVVDLEGVVWAHSEEELIWENVYDSQDDFGYYYVQGMIKEALDGGGWFSYRSDNVSRSTYLQLIEKGGKKFVLAAGYYPVFKAQAVISLVRGAATLFNSFVKDGLDKEIAFGAFMYPGSRFVYGNLYITVYDEQGTILVHGERPTLLGRHVLNERDADGKAVVKEIIENLKNKDVGKGFWVQHRSKNAIKNSYAERVEDGKGHSFYIVSGFYPGETREAVVDLVSRGYRYLKTYGKNAAKDVFQVYHTGTKDTVSASQDFVYGNLYLFVMDFKGEIIISGLSSDIVGVNFSYFQDESGRYVFREIINRLKKVDRTWNNFTVKNAFVAIYAERVEVGLDNLIIACSFYPGSKQEMMRLMVESAGNYLKTHTNQEAFTTLSSSSKAYVRGDLEVFVLNEKGRCYVWGDNYGYIWKNLFGLKGMDGSHYMKDLVDIAKKRSGQIGVKQNNAFKLYYAEPVKKDGKTFIVGSGYYP